MYRHTSLVCTVVTGGKSEDNGVTVKGEGAVIMNGICLYGLCKLLKGVFASEICSDIGIIHIRLVYREHLEGVHTVYGIDINGIIVVEEILLKIKVKRIEHGVV